MQYTIACVSHLYANPKVISILNLWNHELDPRFNLREVRTKISSTDCIRGAVDWLGVKMSAMCNGCHWILTLLQLSTNRTISGFRKSTIATSFWGEMSRRKNPLRSLSYIQGIYGNRQLTALQGTTPEKWAGNFGPAENVSTDVVPSSLASVWLTHPQWLKTCRPPSPPVEVSPQVFFSW